jgi:hypothetical protein
MRWFYLLAALLALASAFMHVVTGGIESLNPVMASKAPLEALVAMNALWHGLTLFYVMSILAFLWTFRADQARGRALGVFLGMFFVLFAALQAGLGYLWFEDAMKLPQWTLLAPIGLFSLLAAS